MPLVDLYPVAKPDRTVRSTPQGRRCKGLTRMSTTNAASRKTVLQRTLKTAICCSGVGLHSGIKVGMALLPAAPDTGVVFRRVDIAGGGVEIPATWDNVTDTRMCSVVGKDGVSVGTIEHLMAALAGLCIDNVIIEINGQEVPAMDGSAAPFVFLIECAGVEEQDRPRLAVKILKTVSIEENGKIATLAPAQDGLSIDFAIDFPSAAISSQSAVVGITRAAFKAEVARARTFGFLDEVAQLKAAGLARGGSLENAVVISGDRVLNEDGLRFEDEFVRHKVLDAVGDLYLAGRPIIGHYTGIKAGHNMTNRLLRALFADRSAWALVEASEDGAVAAPIAAEALRVAQ